MLGLSLSLWRLAAGIAAAIAQHATFDRTSTTFDATSPSMDQS